MMQKISLIVEGGGMRALYAAGILDCLIQQNLYWNNVYGVSAGACHALSYMSRQFDRARRVNIHYAGNIRYAGLYCIMRYGTFFGFDYIFNKIPIREPLDWYTFFQNQNENRKFIITVTHAKTGKPFYIIPKTQNETLRWLEASSSLPVIGKAVTINNENWFDGGIADSIPIKKACEDGCSKHILILTQPYGYRKHQVSRIVEKSLNILYKKYPALISANLRRAQTYNETLEFIENLENAGNAFVFRPQENVITSRLCRNKQKLQRLYESGYNDCVSKLEQLKHFTANQDLSGTH